MPDAPLLAARDLTAPLGVATPALAGVAFRLEAGERLLLGGPSGSGKSTLLRALVLLEPCEGEVLLDGRVCSPETVRELRRRVGYLPQQPVPVAPTVDANLAFAREAAGGVPRRGWRRSGESGGTGVSSASGPLDEEAQRRLLARLGLEGLDGSRRFTSLSGGEQQRVALVRSLTPGPDVLLLDEPTASLDAEHVADVVELIREWCGTSGRALVWVSHRAGELDDFATRTLDVRELHTGPRPEFVGSDEGGAPDAPEPGPEAPR